MGVCMNENFREGFEKSAGSARKLLRKALGIGGKVGKKEKTHAKNKLKNVLKEKPSTSAFESIKPQEEKAVATEAPKKTGLSTGQKIGLGIGGAGLLGGAGFMAFSHKDKNKNN
jgi:hypothetical protein